jgi:hypothetical protein
MVTRWSHTSRIRAILSIQLKLFKVIYHQLTSYFGQITHLLYIAYPVYKQKRPFIEY